MYIFVLGKLQTFSDVLDTALMMKLSGTCDSSVAFFINGIYQHDI
jgi:hypothetical protein